MQPRHVLIIVDIINESMYNMRFNGGGVLEDDYGKQNPVY